jgi:hypothetical protein
MGKIQNISKLFKGNFLFFSLIIIIIVILFVSLSPKISSQLFPLKREAILNKFIDSTKQNGKIDPQEYWKFREFYSPGYFIFSKNGIDKVLISKTKEKIGIKYDEKGVSLTFLTFSSPYLDSLDMLTARTSLDMIIDKSKLPTKNIIFSNKNCLIYKESPKIIKMIFLLSIDEMKKANGFFNYGAEDKTIMKNENWLNATVMRK